MDLALGDYLELTRVFILCTIDFFHVFGEFYLLMHKSTGTISFSLDGFGLLNLFSVSTTWSWI